MFGGLLCKQRVQAIALIHIHRIACIKGANIICQKHATAPFVQWLHFNRTR